MERGLYVINKKAGHKIVRTAGFKLCERSHKHEKMTKAKRAQMQTVPVLQSCNHMAFSASLAQASAMWLVNDLFLTLVPASALLHDVDSPPGTIQAVHWRLTSTEKPPLTKVLSLLY